MTATVLGSEIATYTRARAASRTGSPGPTPIVRLEITVLVLVSITERVPGPFSSSVWVTNSSPLAASRTGLLG
jgi:hypothetical protein